MKRIACAVTLFLFAIGNNSAVPSPNLVKGSTKDTSPSEQGKEKARAKTVTCDWVSGNGIDIIKLAEDNAVKVALYEAVVSGKRVVMAKKTCATIEGDPLPVYATAKGGKIKITYDYSQDRWLKFPGLLNFFGGNSYTTRKVEIGYLDQGKFIPLKGVAPEGRRLFLRLKGEKYF